MTTNALHLRWRWIMIVVAIFAIIATFGVLESFLTLPVRESDKVEASRQLVAWIVENQSISGLGRYDNASRMAQIKQFFVFCDVAPPEVLLSGNPRVQRVTAQEFGAAFERHRFAETAYITIRFKVGIENEILVEFSNGYGDLAGSRYLLKFRRKLLGLRASIEEHWVS